DPLTADPATSNAPYRVFNIGNSDPVPLMDFIGALESAIGKPAKKIYLPMQPGDVPATYADTALLDNWVGFAPATAIKDGVNTFVNWYRKYYSI
ncbi:MAG: protein CapI, partial [Dechloromonas sp.]|nr:protein CapI [Dechloromonas sp.]